MKLIDFSIKTKGGRNFTRRLWTVFTRFGLSEARTRRALHTLMEVVRGYGAAPTFFIPAVVLRRHPALIAAIAREGAEIGIHGYVHNDYRSLDGVEQRAQTLRAAEVFRWARIPCQGFRNPYLGWTDESVGVFVDVGLSYDSNEAVAHDVVDLAAFSPAIRAGYARSLALFQALPCTAALLRPHFDGSLVRLPTSIPDDEMLFDRLRITDARAIGRIWSSVLRRVYDLGGLYVLNLHPERGVLCRESLEILLASARSQPLQVWLASLEQVAAWWREHRTFRLCATPCGTDRWLIESSCSHRAALLARHLTVEEVPTRPWFGTDARVEARSCVVRAARCPCVALSPATAEEVDDFLREQGYPTGRPSSQDAAHFALYLDLPEGLGATRAERWQRRSDLLQQLDQLQAPLVRFAPWPDGARAALSISGDIDSVTIQDFFLRILEVENPSSPWRALPAWAQVPHVFRRIPRVGVRAGDH
jgi:peptidoglycan/xylan/chitin deacetylase (PgdA/CDA1 family)